MKPIRYTDNAEKEYVSKHTNILILVFGRAGGMRQNYEISEIISDRRLLRYLREQKAVFMLSNINELQGGGELLDAHGIEWSDVPVALYFHASGERPIIVTRVSSAEVLIRAMDRHHKDSE
jgi:hypothetical protein